MPIWAMSISKQKKEVIWSDKWFAGRARMSKLELALGIDGQMAGHLNTHTKSAKSKYFGRIEIVLLPPLTPPQFVSFQCFCFGHSVGVLPFARLLGSLKSARRSTLAPRTGPKRARHKHTRSSGALPHRNIQTRAPHTNISVTTTRCDAMTMFGIRNDLVTREISFFFCRHLCRSVSLRTFFLFRCPLLGPRMCLCARAALVPVRAVARACAAAGPASLDCRSFALLRVFRLAWWDLEPDRCAQPHRSHSRNISHL